MGTCTIALKQGSVHNRAKKRFNTHVDLKHKFQSQRSDFDVYCVLSSE